jgi:hypothetical protein
MNATISILIPFLASVLLSGEPDQESLRMKTPPRAGAPLQLVGTVFSDTSLAVLLVNVSGREVTRVVMGVVLEDQASVVPSVTRTGIPCHATVPPDGFVVLKEVNVGFDEAATYFRSKGIKQKGAVIGITDVRFADGSEWSYPLAEKGYFDEQRDQALAERVKALQEKQFEDEDPSWAFSGSKHKGKVSTCR